MTADIGFWAAAVLIPCLILFATVRIDLFLPASNKKKKAVREK